MVIDYLQFMSNLGPFEDLTLRYVTERREQAFFVSFLIRLDGRTMRQRTLLLRDEQQEVSATVTHGEKSGAPPKMIERLLFSIRLATRNRQLCAKRP
jgi:hypothetical protein